MPFNIKYDETPNSSKPSLCDNCRFSLIVNGSNGEKIVSCSRLPYENSTIRMKVVQCNKYMEVNRQTLEEMEKVAWLLGTKKIVGLAGGIPSDVEITWSKPEDRKENRTLHFYGPQPGHAPE
jgi:hypothetical protein